MQEILTLISKKSRQLGTITQPIHQMSWKDAKSCGLYCRNILLSSNCLIILHPHELRKKSQEFAFIS